MDFLLVILAALGLVLGLFIGLFRAGIKLDKERRAANNQDLADRIRAGR